MSLLYVDSFDGYTVAELSNYWTDNPIIFNSSISTSTFRNGTAAANPSSFGISRGFANQGSLVIGFALFPAAYSGQVLAFWNASAGTSTDMEMYINGDGNLRLSRKLGGNVDSLAVTSPKYAIRKNQWNYIEFTYGIGGAAFNEIRIDGQVAYSGNINTIGTATASLNVNAVMLCGNGFNNFFDDLYLASCDGLGVSAAVGDSGVLNLMPTADGSFTEWTPNSGVAHWSRINEIPADGDTSYNASGTTTATFRDTYKVSTSIIANTDVVPGAQLCQITKNDGTAGTLTPIILVAGAQSTNAAFDYAAPGIYTPEFSEYDTNPIAATTWTGSTINTVEWGIKKK